MDYLRRLQMERPVLFWVVTARRRLRRLPARPVRRRAPSGPLGLPSWAPLLVVLAVLVVIARRQQRALAVNPQVDDAGFVNLG